MPKSGNATTIGNSRTYTGQQLDLETGLYHYRNRYYHAQLGSFISRDPIGYAGRDLNLYRYVGNSPMNYAALGLEFRRIPKNTINEMGGESVVSQIKQHLEGNPDLYYDPQTGEIAVPRRSYKSSLVLAELDSSDVRMWG